MAKDEAGSWNIVQGIILKSTDFLRRIIASAGGQGGVTLSYLCPYCNNFSFEALPERSASLGGAQSVDKKYECGAPNMILVVRTGVSASEAKVFKAHAALQGLCENLIHALKLLANQQKDGDSPIQRAIRLMVCGLFRYEAQSSNSAKDVGQAFVGKCLALFESVGQCAVARSLHALECHQEVWTTMVLSELVEFESCVSEMPLLTTRT